MTARLYMLQQEEKFMNLILQMVQTLGELDKVPSSERKDEITKKLFDRIDHKLALIELT